MKVNLFHSLLDKGFDAQVKSNGIKVMLNRKISKQEVYVALDGQVDYSDLQRLDDNSLFIAFDEESILEYG